MMIYFNPIFFCTDFYHLIILFLFLIQIIFLLIEFFEGFSVKTDFFEKRKIPLYNVCIHTCQLYLYYVLIINVDFMQQKLEKL